MNTVPSSNIRQTILVVAALIGGALLLVDSRPGPAVAPPARPVPAADPPAAAAGLETAAIALAEERGRAFVALHATAPIDARERGVLERSRAESGVALDAALGRLPTILGAGYPAVERVRAARRHVESLRVEVDHALAAPREGRDDSLARRWFRSSTDLIEGLHQSLGFVSRWRTGGSSAPHSLMALQRDAWRLVDIAGRERAMVGAAIASGRPMSAAERNAIVVYRNRLASDWRRLERVAAESHLVPGLHADVERVRRQLFGELARARGLVLDSSARHAAYPFTAQQWFSFASQSIDAVVALRRRAAQVARAPVGSVSNRLPLTSRGMAGAAGYADPAPALHGWSEVDAWRRAERARLLAARAGLRGAGRAAHVAEVLRVLRDQLDAPAGRVIGFYWPYRGEIDLRPLMHEMIARGARIALPAAVARERPLEYRRWHPDTPLERNALGIPVPAPRDLVRPGVILAPLLGFDGDNYRLGLGGGYFDRTLAAFAPTPWTIGVGLELARLTTIFPQPHDVPLDVVVTEARVRVRSGRPLAAGA